MRYTELIIIILMFLCNILNNIVVHLFYREGSTIIASINTNKMGNFKIIWDKSTLKRTEYEDGKYYTSKKFKSIDLLVDDKDDFDSIQQRREAKGRNKIETILKS